MYDLTKPQCRKTYKDSGTVSLVYFDSQKVRISKYFNFMT